MRVGHQHCPRCREEREVDLPWAGWRHAATLWKVAVLTVMVLSPVMATDLCVMLPIGALIAAAGPSILREAAVPPKCRACGLPLDGRFEALEADAVSASEA